MSRIVGSDEAITTVSVASWVARDTGSGKRTCVSFSGRPCLCMASEACEAVRQTYVVSESLHLEKTWSSKKGVLL